MDGRPNRRNKAAFLNFTGLQLRFRDGLVWTVGLTGVMWTGPKNKANDTNYVTY